MSFSVGQRIVLTMVGTLVLFLVTSWVAYSSFNTVSAQLSTVVQEAAPRVNISANLRANLADAKYRLLQYVAGRGQSTGSQMQKPTQQQVQKQLDALALQFEQDFETLRTLGVDDTQLQSMQRISGEFFKQSQQVVQSQAAYLRHQQQLVAQAEDFGYASQELGYAFADLLEGEYRFEFLSAVKPLGDASAYLISQVNVLLQTQDAAKLARLQSDVTAYIKRIDGELPKVKTVDTDAYEELKDAWDTYRAQLNSEDATLNAYLQSLQAQRDAAAILLQVDKLIGQSDTLINQLAADANTHAELVEQHTLETLSQGKLLIAGGALLAALFSAFFGYRLLNYLQTGLTRVVGGIEQIAAGNLQVTLETNGNDELTRLADCTNRLAKEQRHLIEQIIQAVGEVQDTARTGSDISRTTLVGVEQQGQESSRLSATATEMEASATEVAAHAEQTLSEAVAAQDVLRNNSDALLSNSDAIKGLASELGNAMGEVNQLQEHSDAIGDVIHVIREIAEQTNLLALNAAIEAARAGEQGRGFAVVADEVRSLASRTQTSTEQIQSIIGDLREGANRAVATATRGQSMSQESVASVEAVQQALSGISEAVTRITGMSQQMASASEQQTHVAESINQQINRIAQLCDESAGQAQQGSAISRELEQMAQYLHSLAERFNR